MGFNCRLDNMKELIKLKLNELRKFITVDLLPLWYASIITFAPVLLVRGFCYVFGLPQTKSVVITYVGGFIILLILLCIYSALVELVKYLISLMKK
jgi:hypothetical protein